MEAYVKDTQYGLKSNDLHTKMLLALGSINN